MIIAAGKVRLQESLEKLSQTTSPSFNVRVLGNSGEFVNQLKDHGFEPTPAENNGWDIESERLDLAKLIWASADESGAVIQSMTPARNSLEEIFLDTVREAENANS